MSWTYRTAGVDRNKIRKAHLTIAELIKDTYGLRLGRFGEVLEGFGHYASLIDLTEDKALALHCDGCGTKVLVAQLMNKYDTIGIDCVAMCVNDLICIGAEPTTLIDYLALEQPDEKMVNEIMKGLVKAAEKTKTSIIGGETAIMPDIIKGAVKGRGFDLAAFCLGIVKKNNIIRGDRLKPGDTIIGVRSSGIHSNGFSLARKVLLQKAELDLKDKPPELERTIGEELLEPTNLYVDAVMSVIETIDIHAIAHITGGAFAKLRRFEPYADVGFHLDKMPEPHPIFKLIQKTGGITNEEMYRTFNMGIGLCIMTPENNKDKAVSLCEAQGLSAYDIGKVVKNPGVRLDIDGKTVSF